MATHQTNHHIIKTKTTHPDILATNLILNQAIKLALTEAAVATTTTVQIVEYQDQAPMVASHHKVAEVAVQRLLSSLIFRGHQHLAQGVDGLLQKHLVLPHQQRKH